jgi:DNA-binding transcriptional LysR family regulator
MSNTDFLRNASGMLIFSQVVEEGSFSAAARRLGISKASVSREISALERRLGAQLLRRTTRQMSLTEVGDVFHERCKRVLEEAEAAELSVSRLQAAPRGAIRMAVPMSFGHLQLAPRLPRFLARYPNVQVDLDVTDRVIDLVHEKMDLSVRIRRPREGSYVLRKLCPIRGLLCASPEYLEARGAPSEPSDLREHNCLGYHGPSEIWPFSSGESIETRGSLYADNGDALRRAALAGLGVVYLPTFVVGDDLRAGRLRALLTQHTHVQMSLYAVYPESRHISPKVRAMLDWLVEELGPEPDWDAGLPVAGREPADASTTVRELD